MFLAKYGSIDLYDIYLERRFIIDHEQLQFDRNTGWTLIGNTEEPDGSLLDHEYKNTHDLTKNHQVLQYYQLMSTLYFYQIEVVHGQ